MMTDDERLTAYGRALLNVLWGYPNKEPSLPLLTTLQGILDDHVRWLAAQPTPEALPEAPTKPSTGPVRLKEEESDDLTTLTRWMDEGEWIR